MSGSSDSSVAAVPLSRRQMLFWLDRQLFPTACYHNLLLTLELGGPLDVTRLQGAWRQVTRDFDALSIGVDDRTPMQVWIDEPAAPLEVVDLRSEPQAISHWIAGLCNWQPRRNERLWRAGLVRLADEKHVFCLCQHHLISDGMSMLLLTQQLAARYAERGEVTLTAGAPSFRDYLELEAQYASSEKGQRDRAYWDSKLKGGAPPLRLYGIPHSDRSIAIDRWTEKAGAERARALEAMSATPPFATLSSSMSRLVVAATALAAFVYRVGGNREVVIGIPFANRPAAFSRTYGLFMEQVFLRAEVDGRSTFLQLAEHLRRDTIESFRHGRACVSDRGLEYVTLNMLPAPPVKFGDLDAVVRCAPSPTFLGAAAGQGDLRDTLSFELRHSSDGDLLAQFDLHAATFDATLRQRIRSHLWRMLDALLANPNTPIDSVDLMDEDERRGVLAATQGSHPGSAAPDVVVQIAEQVRRNPERTAVIAPDGMLRYAELDAISNRLARRLRALGVDRESRVGVSLSRGARELVALLATLKAGGAYVPLDPSHPIDRLRLILEDAAPQVLLFDATSPFADEPPAGAVPLAIEHLEAIAPDYDASPLGLAYRGHELAYVLFTSGSTGRPKGVEVLRGAFANFLRSMAHTPGMSADDRIVAITTTAFDIAGLELFLPLWAGASVHIADRETAKNPRRLRALLEQEPITVMQATPATWRLLLDAGWEGNDRIRLLCGGEALHPELAAKLVLRGKELWNVYGPTETTVWSSLDLVKPGFDRITIGRPIDRTQMYVIDSAGHLAPFGLVGELCIGGDGLARGYRGRPELTAERFVQNPYGATGDRIYRTGDLARLLSDGRFECLGRVDHQVKIRGFRIELGEIESVLRAVPGVREALVVARQDGASDPSLIAYWIGEAVRDAIHERARRKLPTYMVPSSYVRLESFPLNTNGKIDRKRLPAPELHIVDSGTVTRPRTDAEARIAAIWADILHVPDVGVDEDFFSIGGTSALAIEAHARIEQALGLELPLGLFFENPTISGLLAHLDTTRSKDDPIVVWLRRGPPDVPPLHCLLGVQLYQDLAVALQSERSVIGLHVPIRYVPQRDRRPTVSQVASRYVELIRREQPHGPYHLAGLCYGGIVAYEAARQLEQMNEQVPVVVIFDGILPRAYSVNTMDRITGLVQTSLRDPRHVLGWMRTRGVEFAKRIANTSYQVFARNAVDVPINGPEVEAETRRYETTMGRLSSHLVVFRASERNEPRWRRIAPDLGWTGLAAEVSIHEIHAGHLDIVRDPHARTVATILAPTVEMSTPRSSLRETEETAKPLCQTMTG